MAVHLSAVVSLRGLAVDPVVVSEAPFVFDVLLQD